MKSVHSKLGARLDQATEEERRVIKLMLQMFATGHIVSWSHRHAMEEARRRGLPPAVDEQPTLGCVKRRQCIQVHHAPIPDPEGSARPTAPSRKRSWGA